MSDPYFENSALHLLFKSAGAVPATDRTGKALTAAGDAAVVADGGALTGYYLTLDGTGDYVTTPGVDDFQLGAGDFTIDFGFKVTASALKRVLDYYDASGRGWYIAISTSGYLEWWNSTKVFTGSVAINTGSRFHGAIIRSAGKLYIATNGTFNTGFASDAVDYNVTPAQLTIGSRAGSTVEMTGGFDFIRITPGVARWTANFTPPTLDDLAAQYKLVCTDSLTASGSADRSAKVVGDAAESALFSAASVGSPHGIVAESLSLSGSAERKTLVAAAMVEMIGLSGLLATKSIQQGGATESVALGDAASSNAKLSVKAVEGLRIFEVEALYASLDELVSVWVANVATAAHSRYAQYGFNSFCTFEGKYYGCKSDGIYELTGDKDGAAAIPWSVTLPEMDFGSPNLKRFESVFVGAKSAGQLVLKVVQDKNHIYHYNVIQSGNEGRMARAVMGRGAVGRYWQLELASDTERTELDSIDFSVSVLSRKV